MKFRKQAAPVPPISADAAGVVAPTQECLSKKDVIAVTLFFILFTVTQLVSTARVTLASALIAAIFVIRRSSFVRLQKRMSVALLGFLALTIMFGVGLLISPYDLESLYPFYKYFGAVALVVIPLCCFEKRHIRACLWGLMGSNVFHALLSIEGATTNVVYPQFVSLMTKFGLDYASFSPGTFSTRLNGLYNASNVTASIHALMLFIGLYLIQTAVSNKERIAAYVMSGINAIMFFACVSRGALLFFALSCVVYLVLVGKEFRLELFVRMAIILLFTVACQMVCALPAITNTVIPLLITVLYGLAVFLVDLMINQTLGRILRGRTKLIGIIGAVLAACVAVFAVVAFSITGPYTFSGSERVTRVVDLAPGTYTISGDWDGDPQVIVQVKNEIGLFTGYEYVYSGPLSEAEFTIDDDILRVQMVFTGDPSVQLRNVTISDGTSVKLGYPLLPESLVGRLQGSILTDSSFVLRKQYIIDGLKIFLMSPIVGCGLGSSEGLFTAVQSVYYKSMYIHNHLIQFMADMGLLGLLSYLAFTGGVVLLLLRCYRKKKGDPFAAMMLTVLFMINTHSLIEFNFSIRCFLTIAILLYVLAMIAMEDETAVATVSKKTLKTASIGVFSGLMAFLAFFGVTLETYRLVHYSAEAFETTDFEEFMQRLDTYITLDMYDDTYYKLSFINNAIGNPKYIAKANRIAEGMINTKNFTKCSGVAEYFYLPSGNLPAMFNAFTVAIWQKAADPDAWNITIETLRGDALPRLDEEFMSEYLDGVLELRDYYISYNQDRLQQIELTDENAAFLDAALDAWKSDMSSGEVLEYLMEYSEVTNPTEPHDS